MKALRESPVGDPNHLKMKGGMIIPFAIDSGKGNNIFKNKIDNDQKLNEQIELFSKIIIEIYLQNEKHHEKGRPTDGS
jgi:hypothetical protein